MTKARVELENSEEYHAPVMTAELLRILVPTSGKIFIDATLGGGGHAEAMLEASPSDFLLVGIDRDLEAIAFAKKRLKKFGSKIRFVHGKMRNIADIIASEKLPSVDGIYADLGVSSWQLNSPERGFSFRFDAPLDMRMDKTDGPTAADLVNELSETELANIIFEFGEERFSRRIAGAICRTENIETTGDLVKVIEKAVPPYARSQKIHPATRTFQALRIAVNDEMGELKSFLEGAPQLLSENGKLAIMSYHSLEDRMVKHSFRGIASEGPFKVLTKKAIIPSDKEQRQNPRSRSAKLRAIERTAS